MISQYNATEASPGPDNLLDVVGRRLTLRGFVVGDHLEARPQLLSEMAMWIMERRMKWRETITEGVAGAPDAFVGLFKGEQLGKVLVRVGPDAIPSWAAHEAGA